MNKKAFGFTLVELVIATILMTLLSLSYFHIDYFGRFHAINSDRKARLQNNVALVMQRLSKDASRAIGDYNHHAASVGQTIDGDQAIKIWVDVNGNGRRDTLAGGDRVVAYQFTDTGEVYYYSNCVGDVDVPNCGGGSSARELLATRIIAPGSVEMPVPLILANANLEIYLRSRWDVATDSSQENPEVNMYIRLNMPAVSNR
jgi:hypothetical protein